MFPFPFAFLLNSAGVEWLDAVVALVAFVTYLVLGAIWPGLWLRPAWWLICRCCYRVRSRGIEHLPKTGPALLVCPALEGLDWMFVRSAVRRPIRNVVAIADRSCWSCLFARNTQSIILEATTDRRGLIRVLREITQALAAGEMVCVSTAIRLRYQGAGISFGQAFRHIQKRFKGTVPVIPVDIRQLWGSLSVQRKGKRVLKWPERIPYPVRVRFGATLPSDCSVADIRLAIQVLSAETTVEADVPSRPAHRHFVRVAARFRNIFRTALIDTTGPKPRAITFGKTLVGSICIARWLKPQLGEQPNVGLWLPSSVGSALANIALALLGRTTVNLNYTSGIETTRSAVRQTGLRVVVTSRRFLDRMPLDLGPDVLLIRLEDAAKAIGTGQRVRTFLTVLLLPGWILEYAVLRLGRHRLEDLATIIFSSGSTAEPKGVMLSHRNIVANVESFVAHLDLNRYDRVLGILPFFHSFGYTVTLWAPLLVGGSSVYYPDPRQGKEIGDLCRQHRCTGMLATATFLRFYLRRCEPDHFQSLRILICGAEKLPTSLAKDFEAKFGILPLEGYGCTELSPVVSANIPDQEIAGVVQINNKLGTIGHPIPGVATRVVDPERYQPLPPGQEGMLICKGANVMTGYLGKPELTAQAIRDGWYVTGDIGRIDDDGFITLTGRLSRFAKIAGEMIPLEKIEETIHTVLGEAERVVAVTAIPDDRRGERLIVFHLPTLTMPVSDLTTSLAQQGLPNLWIPADRDFFLIAELPLLGTGKLDLRRLQELALDSNNLRAK